MSYPSSPQLDRLETPLAARYDHRKVAIKVLRPELGSLLGADLFSREIRVAAALNHPPRISRKPQ